MLFSKISAATALAVLAGSTTAAGIKRQSGPVDPSTDPDCTYYDTAYDETNDCSYFEDWWGISHQDLVSWNPSLKNDCSGLKVGNSYCVEVTRKPTSTSSTTTPTASPKPSPTQDGLIDSCTTFYKAPARETCDNIVATYGTFTKAEFIKWNPAVGDDCGGIWADTYYCVGIPGTPTSKPPTATPTGPPKPSPTQEGLIDTCTTFYKAPARETCDNIVKKYGTFTKAEFIKWNPAVGNDCGGIWADTYYCVGIPGTPTSKPPTTTPTGSPKPSPTQEGLISTCTKFYKAVEGDECDKLIARYGTFTKAEFLKWNPAVGSDCKGLWADTYYCVGIPGTPTKPTTTKQPTPTGCTRAHPTPTQPGSLCACTKWYLPGKNEFCADIEKKFGITAAQFNKWNPNVGSDCKGLWADHNICVKA
ncbi:hypothetical protein F4808DRAFT_284737 [Astrocystis sublimbata]|nr:hypothetical protein F4808DRAFT_284737 [Astrocystis sublimbata]